MKPTTLLTISFFALSGTATPIQPRADFVQVPLEEPLNWLPGSRLFPAKIIAAYHADLDQYTAESWAEYVLAKCKTFTACTSSASYSANNSGSTGGRYWFGEVFRGGATKVGDYERDDDEKDGVADSIAYTVAS